MFGLWEEAGIPGENAQGKHADSAQTQCRGGAKPAGRLTPEPSSCEETALIRLRSC